MIAQCETEIILHVDACDLIYGLEARGYIESLVLLILGSDDEFTHICAEQFCVIISEHFQMFCVVPHESIPYGTYIKRTEP